MSDNPDSNANAPENQDDTQSAVKFFYANEQEKPFRFFKMPKLFFDNEKYANISLGAKCLYSFMLDRVSLSKKSKNWTDPEGRVFIYFPIQDVMSLLHVANEKATKLYKELESAGLIQREKNGYGKPTRIYVCDVLEGIHKNRESKVTEIVNYSHENRDTPFYKEAEYNKTDKEIEGNEKLPPNPFGGNRCMCFFFL